eukprot:6544353-Pyramimonas_sp.AAC.1
MWFAKTGRVRAAARRFATVRLAMQSSSSTVAVPCNASTESLGNQMHRRWAAEAFPNMVTDDASESNRWQATRGAGCE